MVLTFSHLFYFFHFYPIRSSTIPRYIKVQLNQISMPLPFTAFWSHTHTHVLELRNMSLAQPQYSPFKSASAIYQEEKQRCQYQQQQHQARRRRRCPRAQFNRI